MRETTAAQIPLCPNLQQGQVRAAARAWGSGGGGGGHGGVGGGGGYHWGGGGGGGVPGPESIYDAASPPSPATKWYPPPPPLWGGGRGTSGGGGHGGVGGGWPGTESIHGVLLLCFSKSSLNFLISASREGAPDERNQELVRAPGNIQKI